MRGFYSGKLSRSARSEVLRGGRAPRVRRRSDLSDRMWVLVNPGGGRGRTGRYLARLRERAAALGAPVHVSATIADLTRVAREAAVSGVERLVVAGGDGTVHHAIQGLVHSATALAILPLGSGNDLAATLGI